MTACETLSANEQKQIFPGESEMARRMRAFDWSKSALGPPTTWPQNLKNSVWIMLTSRQPMFVWWGEQFTNLYNDGIASFLFAKHPAALGQPASAVWPEIWEQIGPRAEFAMRQDEGTYDEALPFIIYREGHHEEAYVTFSYSPIPDDHGGFGGILCPVTEETGRIIGERRMELLHDLAARTSDARTWHDACTLAATAIDTNPDDLPFALIYVIDKEMLSASLAGTAGISRGNKAAPEVVALDAPSLWPLEEVSRTCRTCLISDLTAVSDELPKAREQYPVTQASAMPIAPSGKTGMAGVLVVGLNPLRLFDDNYQHFLELVAGEISAAITNEKLEAINKSLIDEIKAHTKARGELQTAKENLVNFNEELKLEVEEVKQAEEQLLEAKEAAEAAAHAMAEFLANISHEIRTPMNSIMGFTELLLDEPLSPEQMDSLETIRINGDALLTIINDILDFSKIESDKLVLEEQPFNLRQCAWESLDLVAVRAAEKGLNLAYTVDKNVQNTIIGDPGRIRQILGNLLSNAVRFTNEGEVVLSVSSSEVDKTGTKEVHFSVRDTGIGIPHDRMDQLFQPFKQMEPSTARLSGGTGLGLVISKRLVEMMGGGIWAESKEGVGSTFHFIIKAPSSLAEPEPAAVSTQLAGKRVLIIADNKTNRRILSKQVFDWGMVPMAASSGQEALRYISRGDDFDIAILDTDLQTMDSGDLEEKIRKHNKALPLARLASLGKHIPLKHACLTKPIKPSQLHQVLTDILSEQPSQWPMKASEVNQPAESSSLRILMAEDNVSSQKVALQMLKKLGYRADVAANGKEVLQALECQHYDIVLMDIKMPEMNGLEATRFIRQRWPDNSPKVIAITAYALEGDRERFINAGMDDYIAKPMTIEDLAKALKKHGFH